MTGYLLSLKGQLWHKISPNQKTCLITQIKLMNINKLSVTLKDTYIVVGENYKNSITTLDFTEQSYKEIKIGWQVKTYHWNSLTQSEKNITCDDTAQ